MNQVMSLGIKTSISILKKEDFVCLSRFVSTRNPNQCRMFHVKLIKKFGDLGEIVSFLRKNIEIYDQKSENLYLKF